MTTTEQSPRRARFNTGIVRNPEQLDLVAKTTRPMGWIAILITAIVLIVGVWWSLTATIPQVLTMNGLITTRLPDTEITAPVSGKIATIEVLDGATVASDTVLMRIQPTREGGLIPVIAGTEGQVQEVPVLIGTPVQANTRLAIITPSTEGHPLQAATFVGAAAAAADLPVGAPVQVRLQIGGQVMQGTVSSVSLTPLTSDQTERLLRLAPFVKTSLDEINGAPLLVVFDLGQDPTWVGSPAPSRPVSGTLVSITRVIGSGHPVTVQPAQ